MVKQLREHLDMKCVLRKWPDMSANSYVAIFIIPCEHVFLSSDYFNRQILNAFSFETRERFYALRLHLILKKVQSNIIHMIEIL